MRNVTAQVSPAAIAVSVAGSTVRIVIIWVTVIAVTVISVRVSPPPGIAEVADEDIIGESVIKTADTKATAVETTTKTAATKATTVERATAKTSPLGTTSPVETTTTTAVAT